MFDNPSGTIKGFAIVMTVLFIIAVIVLSIVFFTMGGSFFAIGVGVLILGMPLSIVFGAFIYGYGDIVEDISAIRWKLEEIKSGEETRSGEETKQRSSSVWKCVNCGQLTRTNPCSCCGKESK